jgi:hypothetical protein
VNQNRAFQHLGVVKKKLANIVFVTKGCEAFFAGFFSSYNAFKSAKQVKVLHHNANIEVAVNFTFNAPFFQQRKRLTRLGAPGVVIQAHGQPNRSILIKTWLVCSPFANQVKSDDVRRSSVKVRFVKHRFLYFCVNNTHPRGRLAG